MKPDGLGGQKETSTGCRDQKNALRVVADWWREAEKVRAGVLKRADLDARDAAAVPIVEHVQAHVDGLRTRPSRRGTRSLNANYIADVEHRLARLVAEMGLRKLADITPTALRAWVERVAAKPIGMGPRNSNAHVKALGQFSRWCVRTGRLTSNPLQSALPLRDERACPTRPRRALRESELVALLEATRLRPIAEAGRQSTRKPDDSADESRNPRSRRTWKLEELDASNLQEAYGRGCERLADKPERLAELRREGRQRQLIYALGATCGLRLNEIRTLTAKNFCLDDSGPHILLSAEHAKNERGARIPLSSDLAAVLCSWASDLLDEARKLASATTGLVPMRLAPDAQVLSVPASNSSFLKRFNADAKAAGITKCDEHGRTVDVHSLRYTAATRLLRAGASVAVVQKFMRLSSADLLMRIYADLNLDDASAAVEMLPTLVLDAGDDRTATGQAARTGTDDEDLDAAAAVELLPSLPLENDCDPAERSSGPKPGDRQLACQLAGTGVRGVIWCHRMARRPAQGSCQRIT